MIINRMHKFILLLVLGIDIEKVKVILWDLKATLIFPFFLSHFLVYFNK